MKKSDLNFEMPLRPQTFDEFTGQKPIIERLLILIKAAKKRKEPIDHLLLSGPPGLGKTTLAQIIAKTMGTQIVVTSGPVLEKAGDLAGILTNLEPGGLLFIDEIHRLSRNIEEYLYPAIEDFHLDLMIDSGPNARALSIPLNRFTLIGATTKSGLLSNPLRGRFNLHLRLDPYDIDSLTTIVLRSQKHLKFCIDEASARVIAQRSRGTPRTAHHLIRWVRDFSQIHTQGKSSLKTTIAALNMLAIDEKGLDEMDKKILTVIMDHHNGGPVGLQTLALAVGEETTTISEVYEPYLILQGLLRRTPRGRKATHLAYKHLGRKYNHGADQ